MDKNQKREFRRVEADIKRAMKRIGPGNLLTISQAANHSYNAVKRHIDKMDAEGIIEKRAFSYEYSIKEESPAH